MSPVTAQHGQGRIVCAVSSLAPRATHSRSQSCADRARGRRSWHCRSERSARSRRNEACVRAIDAAQSASRQRARAHKQKRYINAAIGVRKRSNFRRRRRSATGSMCTSGLPWPSVGTARPACRVSAAHRRSPSRSDEQPQNAPQRERPGRRRGQRALCCAATSAQPSPCRRCSASPCACWRPVQLARPGPWTPF